MLADIESIAAKILPYAPTVAGLLGGPYTALAMKAITSVFGASSDSNINDILANASTDPDIQVKLKSLEDDLSKFKIEQFEKDNESARAMEIEAEKSNEWLDMPKLITIFLIVSFVTISYLLFTKSINPNNSTLLGSMIGLLTREFIQACKFYLGGNDDSK